MAIIKLFAAQGPHVWLADRQIEAAEQAIASIRAAGWTAQAADADVAEPAASLR